MCERYVVHESDGSRDITFVATGPEVALAIEAAKLPQDRNINVTVVSMSCWNLFDQQPYNHRAETLGNGPKIASKPPAPSTRSDMLVQVRMLLGSTILAHQRAPKNFMSNSGLLQRK